MKEFYATLVLQEQTKAQPCNTPSGRDDRSDRRDAQQRKRPQVGWFSTMVINAHPVFWSYGNPQPRSDNTANTITVADTVADALDASDNPRHVTDTPILIPPYQDEAPRNQCVFEFADVDYANRTRPRGQWTREKVERGVGDHWCSDRHVTTHRAWSRKSRVGKHNGRQ